MITPEHTAIANCPDFLPVDIYAIPHHNSVEASREEVSTAYHRLLELSQSLAAGDIVIDPKVVTTDINSNRVECRAVNAVVGDMHPNFALLPKPDRFSETGSLFIQLNQVNRIKRDWVESYHFKLDAAGNGRYELKTRPFELSMGILEYVGVNSTQGGQLTTKNLAILDALYSFIANNRVTVVVDGEPPLAITPLHKYIGRQLRRIFQAPFTEL